MVSTQLSGRRPRSWDCANLAEVMRRRHDDWINATHILKAAGFDKPARTRILEREVQKEEHEKIQGGYGKYQGAHILGASMNLQLISIRNLGSS
jgi:hypothetical protein